MSVKKFFNFKLVIKVLLSNYTVLQYCMYCSTGFLCTLSCPRALRVRSFTASSCAHSAPTSPRRRPSSTTGMEDGAQGGRGAPVGVIPRLHSSLGRWLVFGIEVVTCRKNSKATSSCLHVCTVRKSLIQPCQRQGVFFR